MSGAVDYDSDETVADIENMTISSPSILNNDFSQVEDVLEEGKQKEPEAEEHSLLVKVQQEQLIIEESINNSSAAGSVESMQRLSAIGESLRKINVENQNERKSIAALVSQADLSQGAISNHPLREKLITLAEKQKVLLSCMAKHKELLKKIASCNPSTIPSKSTTTEKLQPIQGSQLTHSKQKLTSCDGIKLPDQAPVTIVQVSNPPPPSTTSSHLASDNGDHQVPDLRSAEAASDQVSNPRSEPVQSTDNVDLSHPVPLEILIKHKLLSINDVLSCSLLGCQFQVSILPNGQLLDSNRKTHSSPQRWLTFCWSVLGHDKRINRRQAYKMITTTKKVSLLSLCEQYSREQISSYKKQELLNKSLSTTTTNSQPMECEPTTNQSIATAGSTHRTIPQRTSQPIRIISKPRCTHFDLGHVLTHGRILSHTKSHSLSLPDTFWGNSSLEGISVDLWHRIYRDLNWN